MRKQELIFISSPDVGSGSTTIAANLATALSQGNKRVLLVECDTKNPRLNREFGIREQPKYYYQDVLLGRDPSLATMSSEETGVNMIFARKEQSPARAINLLLDLAETLGNTNEYDYVLFDTYSELFGLAAEETSLDPLIVLTPRTFIRTNPIDLEKLFKRVETMKDITLNQVEDNAYSLLEMEAKMVFKGAVIGILPFFKKLGGIFERHLPAYYLNPKSQFSVGVKRLADYYLSGESRNKRRVKLQKQPRYTTYGGSL